MKPETISLVVTNIVVILGWFVVFRQSLLIKSRDDIRNMIDITSNTVDEIYNLCKIYYSYENIDHINYDSTSIKAKFVLLSHYLGLLRAAGMSGGVSAALIIFKMHATGGHFETLNFHSQETVPNWKSELAASAEELKFRVEGNYFDWSRKRSNPFRFRG